MALDDLFTPTVEKEQATETSTVATAEFDTGVTVKTSRTPSGGYETTVTNGMFNGETQTYDSKEAALAGHVKWVEHASKPIPHEIEELVTVLATADDEGNPYRLAAHLVLHGYVKTEATVGK